MELADHLVDVLRRTALAGSTREIPLEASLSEMGLGLDSLALVEFFVAIEEELGVQLLESDWIAREELTLHSLVEHVRASAASRLPATARSNQRGFARRLVSKLYDHEDFLLLSRDLRTRALPQLPDDSPLRLVVATERELDAIASLYDGARARHKRRKAERWLQRDYTALLAFFGDRIAGIDWIARGDHHDSFTGLVYAADESCCFGMDLDEHPEFAGRGVGVALLLHSLHWARERGCTKQWTVVSSHNVPMLGAAIQLLGFEKAGSIRTHRWLRRPISSWRIGERQGLGGRVSA